MFLNSLNTKFNFVSHIAPLIRITTVIDSNSQPYAKKSGFHNCMLFGQESGSISFLQHCESIKCLA